MSDTPATNNTVSLPVPDDSIVVSDSVEYNPESRTYRLSYDCENEPPSQALIGVVSLLEAQDDLSLDPLYERVDPIALDSLICDGRSRNDQSETTVSFTYCEYDVRVSTDGTIEIQHPMKSGSVAGHPRPGLLEAEN